MYHKKTVKNMSPFKVKIIQFDDGERYPILQYADTGFPVFMPV